MAETEIIFSVQEPVEGGYEARVTIFSPRPKAWKGCVGMVRDAVRCHFNGDSAPAVIRLHIVKDEVIPA